MTAKYYHRLTYWQSANRSVDKIIGSDAQTIDDAVRERCRLAKQYHPHQIIALTTHNVAGAAK